jgi:cytochrome P450
MRWGMAALPLVFRVLRGIRPILKLGKTYIVTRYDDVQEVFATDRAFGVPWKPKLDVIMGGEPFFLGMADGPDYRRETSTLRQAVRRDDVPMLADRVEAMAQAIVDASGGRIDVVDLVRTVSFGYLSDYLGVPEPEGGSLAVWGTRLFEYQFVASDAPLIEEVKRVAPLFRQHIQGVIEHRRLADDGPDDVLGRCLAIQSSDPAFTDARIGTDLMGLIVGGPPQPPMVVPQAFEQLLRRPEALVGAQRAARGGDDELLRGYVREAMRFDPLAPGLPRTVLTDWTIARGTRHQRAVKPGATVIAAFASAMRDDRRVPDPERFNPRRQPHEYIHFGYGLHECFGVHINHATLHRMIKPLLRQHNLRRAPGLSGYLSKAGVFAKSLWVQFD